MYTTFMCVIFPRDNALPWTRFVSATCHRWWCWPLNWTILTGEESCCYCVSGEHYEGGGTSNVFWLFLHGYFCKRNRLNKKFTAAMHCDVSFVYFRILSYGGRHFLVAGMYCSDWEKGANCIALCQRKWLHSMKTCVFCKIQAHRPVYASLVGVVTCVGKELYD